MQVKVRENPGPVQPWKIRPTATDAITNPERDRELETAIADLKTKTYDLQVQLVFGDRERFTQAYLDGLTAQLETHRANRPGLLMRAHTKAAWETALAEIDRHRKQDQKGLDTITALDQQQAALKILETEQYQRETDRQAVWQTLNQLVEQLACSPPSMLWPKPVDWASQRRMPGSKPPIC